jgi:hypothetical protein
VKDAELTELIEKATEAFGADLTLALVKHPTILAGVADGSIPVVKALGRRSGHDGKTRSPSTGRFAPMNGPVETKLDNGVIVRHGGAVRSVLRRLAGGGS